MRDDLVTNLRASRFVSAGSDAPHHPVSIGERLSPPAAAVGVAERSENCEEGRSQQAAQLDAWEDEGGTTAGQLPAFPQQHADRHVDEVASWFRTLARASSTVA